MNCIFVYFLITGEKVNEVQREQGVLGEDQFMN